MDRTGIFITFSSASNPNCPQFAVVKAELTHYNTHFTAIKNLLTKLKPSATTLSSLFSSFSFFYVLFFFSFFFYKR